MYVNMHVDAGLNLVSQGLCSIRISNSNKHASRKVWKCI